mmetsp:Transcript_63136/g.136700  ORF Transcript_63136/g.136700 Transcript_63136/m.136700 type:complete len:725 (-) Transcript_63136:4486-6660(-)
MVRGAARSVEVVLVVRALVARLLLLREVEEVRGAVALVVELRRVLDAQAVLHRDVVLLPHEVVVPDAVVRHHEEAQEDVTEQHLHLLGVRGQEAGRIGAGVLVRLAPLEALRRDPVGGQRAAARREAARDDDGLIRQPRLVVRQHAGVECHVLRAEVRLLVGLRVDPAERLQVAEVVVVRQLLRQRHRVVRADLRHHDHAPDLLHLGVVRRRDAVEVGGDLRPEVADADEGLEDVLRHDVRVARLADVLAVDVEVVRAQVQRRRADGAHAPLRPGREGLLLVGRARRHDHLLAVHVRRLRRDGGDLRHLLALLLEVRDLLALDRGGRDLHAEDDVADLALRERGHVHVVLLAVVRQDEVLELHLDVDPLVVGQAGPHVVRLRHRGLVGLQDDLGAVGVDVQRAQDQDHAAEGRVRGDRLQPVVVEVEEHHLRLRGLQDQIAELLDLHAGLEGQGELGALDDDVREVEEVHLQRVQHALARHDDLLRLLLHGQRADQRRDLLGGLPLRQLRQALLAGPHRGVDDLQEELSGPRVEDEDRAVHRLRRQVALEGLVDRDAVHVGVVDEPDDLGAEELAVVLRVQVRLGRLGAVELQALADALAEHVQGRVGLHDLVHGPVQQRLHAGEPVAEAAVQVVRQVHAHQHARRRGVDGHVVRGVVQELGAAVALDVVRVVVAPAELHVDPVLRGRRAVEAVLRLGEERRLGHGPLVGGEEQDVGARGVHLV